MAKYNWRAHKNTRIRYWSTNESGDSLFTVSGDTITCRSSGTFHISYTASNGTLTAELLRTTGDRIIAEGLSVPREIPVHPSIVSAFGNWPAEE